MPSVEVARQLGACALRNVTKSKIELGSEHECHCWPIAHVASNLSVPHGVCCPLEPAGFESYAIQRDCELQVEAGRV